MQPQAAGHSEVPMLPATRVALLHVLLLGIDPNIVLLAGAEVIWNSVRGAALDHWLATSRWLTAYSARSTAARVGAGCSLVWLSLLLFGGK